MSWEQLQEELFEQLFSLDEDYITLSDLLKSIEPISNIWSCLEQILLEDRSNDFDFFKSIDEIKLIDGFIIIKTGLWNYIVIDPIDKRSLTNEECKILFDEEFFLTNFDEAETRNNFEGMYYFEDAGKPETIAKLIDYINEHQNILTEANYINYSKLNSNSRVSICIDIEKQKATIGFAKFEDINEHPSNVNYLFFNKKVEITGTSNPTNNHESLKAMGDRAYGIKIPKSIIPNYIKGEEVKKMTYKKED